ncbi:MAG: regulatory protein RecX [Melioribacteraceae bacterium]|nr:regulatory protein RecX [Melioribacteraceae bacterium]MDD3558169.1 regulatory protein RecX [Melioribacteraceae bacterium]
MVIERIKRKGRTTEILLQDGSSFFISSELFDQSGLSIEQDLSEQEIEWLKHQNELRIVKLSALRFLSKRAHTRYELGVKLKKKKYNPAVIENILDELMRDEILDDEKFAEMFFLEKVEKKRKGVNLIRKELSAKGISKDIIDKVIKIHHEEDLTKRNIVYLAEKKIKSLSYKKLEDSELRNKVVDHLLRKGFEYSDIKDVLNKNNPKFDF